MFPKNHFFFASLFLGIIFFQKIFLVIFAEKSLEERIKVGIPGLRRSDWLELADGSSAGFDGRGKRGEKLKILFYKVYFLHLNFLEIKKIHKKNYHHSSSIEHNLIKFNFESFLHILFEQRSKSSGRFPEIKDDNQNLKKHDDHFEEEFFEDTDWISHAKWEEAKAGLKNMSVFLAENGFQSKLRRKSTAI